MAGMKNSPRNTSSRPGGDIIATVPSEGKRRITGEKGGRPLSRRGEEWLCQCTLPRWGARYRIAIGVGGDLKKGLRLALEGLLLFWASEREKKEEGTKPEEGRRGLKNVQRGRVLELLAGPGRSEKLEELDERGGRRKKGPPTISKKGSKEVTNRGERGRVPHQYRTRVLGSAPLVRKGRLKSAMFTDEDMEGECKEGRASRENHGLLLAVSGLGEKERRKIERSRGRDGKEYKRGGCPQA